jgi:hypothetical protein
VEQQHLHTRAELAALLWPDKPEQAARASLSQALDLAREISSPKAITLVFEGLASLWASAGEWDRATQLFGAIESVYLRRGARPTPLSHKLHTPYVRAAYASLGPQRFALIWGKGRGLTLEAACAVASARSEFHAAFWSAGRAYTLKPVATVD